ncbi:MAG: sialidase family protein, partial [Anaerolineae bacterium]
SAAEPVTDGAGYYVMNNARVVRLSSGRLVAPVARADDAGGPLDDGGHFRSTCYLSDDDGRTWRQAQTWVDLGKRGAMEPGVAEARDGALLMMLRTQFGHLYDSASKDGGETWSKPHMTGLVAPEAPASLARIPGSGDSLIVWNDNYDRGADHGGIRSPLRSAISHDGGYHWYRYHTLESDTRAGFAYTSITFVDDEVMFTYYEQLRPGRLSLRLRALPLSSLYEIGDWRLRQDFESQPDQSIITATPEA